MTDVQHANEIVVEKHQEPEAKRLSGYRRLQVRHRTLIEQYEALKTEHQGLLAEQETLQADIDKLLQQHQQLMKSARSPQHAAQVPWFQGANQTLASLALNPDRHAIEVFITALAVLQRRIDPIVSRLPL